MLNSELWKQGSKWGYGKASPSQTQKTGLQCKCAKSCCKIWESRELASVRASHFTPSSETHLLPAQGEHHYCQLPYKTTQFLTWPQAGYNKFLKYIFIWSNIFLHHLHCPFFSLLSSKFFPVGQPSEWHWNNSLHSLWAAVPWHGKFVCSTYLIAQATRNASSAGVRKRERVTSGLVKARGEKKSLLTYFYGMVQSVTLHWLEGHIHRQVLNKLWSKQALLSSAISF